MIDIELRAYFLACLRPGADTDTEPHKEPDDLRLWFFRAMRPASADDSDGSRETAP